MQLLDPHPGADHTTEQTEHTQWVTGYSDRDVFVIHGNSADYQSSRTQDGKGTVVWKGNHFDILDGIDVLRFDDRDVKATASGQFDIHGQGSVREANQTTYSNVAGTQWIEGSLAQFDVFMINSQKANYGWSKTQDGQGIVVWKGDDFDILHNVEVLRFIDGDVLTSTIM